MSITDELREYIWQHATNNDELRAIADRIDIAHKHAIGYVDDRDPETMAENGWVKLPKDSDGEYIHIGDVMQWPEDGDTFEVVGIGEDGVLFYFDPNAEDETADWTASQNKRHHHAPTVEDVLRGVVTLCRNTWKEGSAFEFYDVDDVMKSGNIAEYAAKLRLAGDAE